MVKNKKSFKGLCHYFRYRCSFLFAIKCIAYVKCLL